MTKVTLTTGKVVLIRDMKVSDSEAAAQEVAPRSNGDANVLQVLAQKALVKRLVVAVDDKALSMTEKEDIDGLFSIREYNQVLTAIKKMTGDDGGNEPRLEVVNSGEQSPG